MRYRVTIKGESGLIQRNGAAGLDTRSPANLEKDEITSKTGSNRTASDDARLRELECQTSLWLSDEGAPTIPHAAIRAMIETGARKLKQGPQVREGLIVESIESFDYDRETLGTTVDELGKNAQFTTAVVVNRNRVLRTRALFPAWNCTFVLYTDPELVDRDQLERWLDIGGRRIGLGDWRPEKSGLYGRFSVASISQFE